MKKIEMMKYITENADALILEEKATEWVIRVPKVLADLHTTIDDYEMVMASDLKVKEICSIVGKAKSTLSRYAKDGIDTAEPEPKRLIGIMGRALAGEVGYIRYLFGHTSAVLKEVGIPRKHLAKRLAKSSPKLNERAVYQYLVGGMIPKVHCTTTMAHLLLRDLAAVMPMARYLRDVEE